MFVGGLYVSCGAGQHVLHAPRQKGIDGMNVLAALVSVCILCAAPADTEYGLASTYAYESGSRTANGERVNPRGFTAAHRTLPFGTRVQVTNRRNGRTLTVRINDRGPFVKGRVIDLTPAGAKALDFDGLAPVAVTVIKRP